MKHTTDLQAIENAAVDWVVHFSSGNPTTQSGQQFEDWLQRDERHLPAFLAAEKLWSDIRILPQKYCCDEHSLQALHDLNRPMATERLRHFQAAAKNKIAAILTWPRLVVAAALIVFFVTIAPQQYLPWRGSVEHYATSTAQTSEITLPDGSRITLGARSALKVAYTTGQRHILFQSGEAFFDIAKDATRPFIVTAGHTNVKVLGTQFNVHQWRQEIQIEVAEGSVKVINDALPSSQAATLVAGQKIAVKNNQIHAVTAIDPTKTGDWRTGRLYYNGASLAQVIDDANRYSRKQIILIDKSLADVAVTTAYRTNQTEKMLHNLSLALSLNIETTERGIFIKRAAK